MALKSAENDIIETFLWMEKNDNGDITLKTAETRPDDLNHGHTVRVSTYGTNTPQEVKSAFYNLFQVLEKYELNKHFLVK